MKRILILLAAIFAFYLYTAAQENDTIPAAAGVLEYEDKYDDGNTETTRNDSYSFGFPQGFISADSGGVMLLTILTILLVFGLPFFIVFIAFYFQYKNRKARYKLSEQALAAGQPIPQELAQKLDSNLGAKGIKSIFIGIGLFIFLWAITGSFSVGTVGLLVMFIGFGELIAYYMSKNKDGK